MIEGKQIFSDDAIRQFLLGTLNSAEQARFEHSLFVDDTLEERVRLTELELSDDYSANRLSRADRDLFHQRFLLTADRARTLKISRALHDNFATAAFDAHAGFWQNAIGIFDIRRHAWKYAFATLTLLLLLLATALLVKKEKRFVYPFAPPKSTPRASHSTPRMTNHSTNAAAPAHNETAPALPLHEGLRSSEESTTTVVLDSETPLESAPTIATRGEIITVQLKLNDAAAELYEVKITTTAGEPVFYANALKRTDEKTLGFDVSNSSLKPGDFQVVLTGIDGESKQSAGTYYFRVR